MREMTRDFEKEQRKIADQSDLVKNEIRQYVEAVQRLDERVKKKDRDNGELREEEQARREAFDLENQMKLEVKADLVRLKDELQYCNDRIRQANEQHDKMIRLQLEEDSKS